jgi:hypothetical protein
MHDLLIAIALAGMVPPQQQAAAEALPPQPEVRPRFEQSLSARGADNAAQSVKVSLRDWTVRDNQKATIKTTGTLLIQVRAGGPINVSVGGQRTERKETEFFTVAAGVDLTIETGNDTVVLTVLQVER